jgi:hypothetical protein
VPTVIETGPNTTDDETTVESEYPGRGSTVGDAHDTLPSVETPTT